MKTESIKTLFCGPKCPFLRMGSRSENDFIKNTSLHSHRVARRMFDSKNMRKDLEVAAKNLDLQLTKLNLFRSGIVHEKYLLETGIISQNTLHQLGWDEREETSILLKFLGVFKQKFLIYDREPTRKQSKQNQSTVPMVVPDANDIDEEFYNEEIWRRTIYEDEFECYSRTECEGSERSIRQLQFGLAEDFPDDFFRYRNLNKDQIFRCINAKLDQTDGFSDQDVEHFLHRPVWSLSHKDRWSLYKNWHLKVREILEENITNMIKTFEVKNERWKRKNKNEIFDIMMQCKLIAMTTTGAAKYMDILRRVAPRIVIVEEAAQVNEQHILGCLHNDLQHLILIGDHQQLKPTVNNYSLSKDHCTDMSMMERLALNGIPFKRLSEQHRMIPVISDLLKNTIYDELVDHESVLTYECIRGMAQNVVFFDHRQPESQRSEFTTSYKNDFEANMLAELYGYLRQQGYKSSEITILSTYNEQVRHLRSLVKPIDDYLHNRFGDNEDNIVQDERGCRRILRQGDRRRNRKGVRITAVDNFQGEENIIILLSLIRSNPNAFIGHLRDEKRDCVSLSRAKKGLYVVGNFEILQKKSKQWKNILEKAKSAELLKQCFPLKCQNHPNIVTEVTKPETFQSLVPEGGCTLPCETQLSCGHICPLKCHNDQEAHDRPCMKKCARRCKRGHPCQRLCHENCGNCREKIKERLPICGHQAEIPCYMDPLDFECQERCEKFINCQERHRCQKLCGVPCNTSYDCNALVKVKMRCGHECQVACCKSTDAQCKVPCNKTLSCDHLCKGTCGACSMGRLHIPCKAKCTRVLICGHTCRSNHPCTTNCLPCEEKCSFGCWHRSTTGCKKQCGEKCLDCKEPCNWKCSTGCKNKYRCTTLCFEDCDRNICNEPCKMKLSCGHPCVGLCGEPCPKLCRICHKSKLTEILFGTEDEPDARFIELTDCQHVLEVTGLDKYIESKCDNSTPSESIEITFVRCPLCSTPIRSSFRYGNILKRVKRDIEQVKDKCREVPADGLNIEEEKKNLVISMNHFKYDSNFSKIVDALQQIPSRTKPALVSHLAHMLDQIYTHVYKNYEYLGRANPNTETARRQIKTVMKWIVIKRSSFSKFELDQFFTEISRLKTLTKIYILLSDAKHLPPEKLDDDLHKLTSAVNDLEYPTSVSEDSLYSFSSLLVEMRKKVPEKSFNLPDDERIQILEAVDMKKGHWFKCPKGHVYCIGECGGAMEKAVCPECNATIGGQSHTLQGDNAVATEMDGATFAAWSEEANNMANFDLQDMM